MKSFEDWYFDLFESGNGICLNQQEIAEQAYSDAYEFGQQSKQAEIKGMVDSIEVKLQWCKTQRNCAKQDCDMQLFSDLNLECEKLTAQHSILMDILK